MATWLVVILFSVGAVLLFAVGLSLTLIFKGHHIDGEISTNRNMRALGITCAVKDAARSGGSARSGSASGACDYVCTPESEAGNSCAACAGESIQ